ncbi:cadherin domain-containing protein [Sneathiella glossodoripedis]|uniref:cadherin domain-containing protein n=1 Tax=Sneathiella glossodoripedis TaxID=418853 RepID=UPI000472270A|nr:cadherin domain-containing protein [Sneathiella glossodoripedis]
MSDAKKPVNQSAEQDLQDLTNSVAKQRNAFGEEKDRNSSSVRPGEADQSLAAIHMGDRDRYEEGDTQSLQGEQSFESDEVVDTGEGGVVDSNDNSAEFVGSAQSFDDLDGNGIPVASDAAPGARASAENVFDDGSLLGATNLEFEQREVFDEPQGLVETEQQNSEGGTPIEEFTDAVPVSMSLDDGFILENSDIGEVVGTVSAFDAEGGQLTFSLDDDAGGMFTIDPETGEIKVAGPLDYETQNNYSVTVNVSDGVNTTQQTYAIEVGDVNEAPEAGNVDLGSVLEDNTLQFTSADLLANSSDVDGDSLSVSNVTVDPAYGSVVEIAPGEFEFTPTEHFSGDDIPFSFTITDGEFSDTAVATLDVTPVSDAPALTVELGDITRSAISGGTTETLSIDASNVHDTGSGFTVLGRVINDDGTLSDPSADYVSNSSGRIGITGRNDGPNGQIGASDINGGVSEELIVQIDGSTTSAEVGFSMLYTNEGGAGHHEQGFYTLYMDGVEVGSGSFTADDGHRHIGTVTVAAENGSAFDQIVFSADNSLTGYSDGTGHADYYITSISVEPEVEDIPVNVYALDITAELVDTDGSEDLSAVTVYNIPSDASLSAGERNEDGSWTVGVADLDGLTLTVPADMEGDFDISVSVTATDGSADPATSVASLSIPKIEHAPEQVALDNNSILEDAAIGDVVGTVTAFDPNGDGLTYTLADDAGGMFSINETTGEITLAGELDFETTPDYSVTVNVSDGGLVTQQVFTIAVGDVNEAVHSVSLDNNFVMEDAATGTVVGTVSGVDPENDAISFSLSDDAGGMFIIDEATGEISLVGDPDYETVQSYNVTVDVSDGVNVTQETYAINIGDAEAPVLTGIGNDVELANVEDNVDLSNMDVFPDLHTRGNLEERVGTEVFEDMVKDAEDIVINYQSEATITFQGEYAGYQNSIGAYQINSDGTITGAELLWGDASTGKLTAGQSTATYDGIESGSKLGFFVISDGFDLLPQASYTGDGNSFPTTGSWMFVNPDFDPATQNPQDHLYNVNTDTGAPQLIYVEDDGTIHSQSGNVFHSTNQEEFNPDADVSVREHFIAGVDQENGILNFGFEDILGGGDFDFNDGMFSVEIDVRDLMEAPNPLFTKDANGNSSFQISDADSTDLQQLVVTVSDVQNGDTLSLSGPYKITGGNVLTFDGQDTGIAIDIVEEGTSITLTLSGEGDLDHYEAIVQNINFSNTSGSHEIAGVRPITVVATDSSGEVSETLVSSFEIVMESSTYGTDGNDSITADAGGDTVYAGSGDDSIFGGAGDDVIYGQDGADAYEFGLNDGMDTFIGGDGGGWSDTIVLSDGMPNGNIDSWLNLTSGTVESRGNGEIFLSEDAAGTITLNDSSVLTFEGVEKIEG